MSALTISPKFHLPDGYGYEWWPVEERSWDDCEVWDCLLFGPAGGDPVAARRGIRLPSNASGEGNGDQEAQIERDLWAEVFGEPLPC